MNGSRLGRGRVGRLAAYGIGAFLVMFLIFGYRATTSEIMRLKDLHSQCILQQEALASQLKVIYEYKVRLEKSLSDEKSSNAAVKQELQRQAIREKSLNDEEITKLNERLKALQQSNSLLKAENEDIKEESAKKEQVALENSKKMEATLRDLRIQLKKAEDDKVQSMQNLKNKYIELEYEKNSLENKCGKFIDSAGNFNSTIDHLKKENLQLQRELDEPKKFNFMVSGVSAQNSQVSARQVKDQDSQKSADSVMQMMRPAQRQMATTKSVSGSAAPNATSPSGQAVAAAPAKLATKKRLPIGVLPIPKMNILPLNNNVNEHNIVGNKIESAAKPPPQNPIEIPAKEVFRIPKLVKNLPDSDGLAKFRQSAQDDNDNNMERILDLNNGADNNDDGPDGHYDEYYKGPQNKQGNNHADPEDDEYRLDYGKNNNFNLQQNE